MDPYRRVNPGERLRIPAVVYNELLGLVGPRRGQRTHGPVGTDPEHVIIRNNSGATVNRFGVLGIDGVIIDPALNGSEFQSRVMLEGTTPGSEHEGKFAIVTETIKQGKLGRALIDGVATVRVTGAAASHCDVSSGDATRLTMSSTGTARVLYAEDGSDERWAIVRIGDPAASGGGTFSGARGRQDTNQSPASGALTKLTNFVWNHTSQAPMFNEGDYLASGSSTPADQFNIPDDGYYYVSLRAAFIWATTGRSLNEAAIYLTTAGPTHKLINTTRIEMGADEPDQVLHVAGVVRADAGDDITFWYKVSRSATNLTISPAVIEIFKIADA